MVYNTYMTADLLHNKINEIKSEKNPLRQARLISDLRELDLISNVKLAELLGVKPSHLSHLIRILRLPEIVLDGYASRLLSLTHLIIMSRVADTDKLVALYEEVLSKSLTIAQTEHRVREILYQVDSHGEYLSTDSLHKYEERLASALGAGNVKIIQTRIQCRIVIEMPGNLEITTKYLEDIAGRFRRKRTAREALMTPQEKNGDVQSNTHHQQVHPQDIARHNIVEVPKIHTHSTNAGISPHLRTGLSHEPPRYEKHTLNNANDMGVEDEMGSIEPTPMPTHTKSTLEHAEDTDFIDGTVLDDEPIR